MNRICAEEVVLWNICNTTPKVGTNWRTMDVDNEVGANSLRVEFEVNTTGTDAVYPLTYPQLPMLEDRVRVSVCAKPSLLLLFWRGMVATTAG